jgi:hypothetical protein
VDLLGRSLPASLIDDPVIILRGYLSAGRTAAALALAAKAVILVSPPPLLGTIAWVPPGPGN